MDVDTSYNFAPSSAPESPAPLSSAPTITTFNFAAAPPPFHRAVPDSAAPTAPGFRNLFEEEDTGYTSSPPQSSPTTRKLARIASSSLLTNQKRPASIGLGKPPILGLNANKKRPRQALSAMITPAESNSPSPTGHAAVEVAMDCGDVHQVHRLPPVRRAFSAMLPPNLLDQTFSSESSFEDAQDMSSPAQAHAKRRQVKTIRRCDGTEDFRPLTGATALMKRDAQVLNSSGHNASRGGDETRAVTVAERDTPRSKYLNAAPGLGGFGDNEAQGKILPCHRVREDGLMRITPTTVCCGDDLRVRVWLIHGVAQQPS